MTRKERIEKFFTKMMPALEGQPVIIKENIRKNGEILRDGIVTGFKNGMISICLPEDDYETKTGKVIHRPKKKVSLLPPDFLEAYDEYVDWVIKKSSFDEKSKRKILKKHSHLNTDYQKAYAGTKTEVTQRSYRAWEIPHTLNIGTRIKNAYY